MFGQHIANLTSPSDGEVTVYLGASGTYSAAFRNVKITKVRSPEITHDTDYYPSISTIQCKHYNADGEPITKQNQPLNLFKTVTTFDSNNPDYIEIPYQQELNTKSFTFNVWLNIPEWRNNAVLFESYNVQPDNGQHGYSIVLTDTNNKIAFRIC